MYKKTASKNSKEVGLITLLALGGIAAALCVCTAQAADKPVPTKPSQAISEEFGDVWGEKNISLELPENALSATTSVTLDNRGTNPIEITSIKSSCACLKGTVNSYVVNPGETTTIGLTIDLSPMGGSTKKSLFINTIFSDERVKNMRPKTTEVTLSVKRPTNWSIEPQELNFNNNTPQTIKAKAETKGVEIGELTLLNPGFKIEKQSSTGNETTYKVIPTEPNTTLKATARFTVSLGDSRVPVYIHLNKVVK